MECDEFHKSIEEPAANTDVFSKDRIASCIRNRSGLNLIIVVPAGYQTVKNVLTNQKPISRLATRTQKTLLPLVAVGGGLAALPANALELGEATVYSRLGQPLRASIAYALAPNERITDSCVSLGTGASASGLPGFGRATISIADGNILLAGKTPIREPMVAASVVIDCKYTANLSREYMLFIDPATPMAAPAVDKVATPTVKEEATAKAAPAAPIVTVNQPTTASRRTNPTVSTVSREPIDQSTRYRVIRGDSVSQIAQRIENRSIKLWPAVNAIFEANPHAFIDNDVNKLKAGSWLTIPDFVATSAGSAPVVSVTAESIDVAVEPVETSEVEAKAVVEAPPKEAIEPVSDSSTDLRPGDIVRIGDNPFVEVSDAAKDNIVIPDTELDGPSTASTSPNVPTAVISTSTQTSSSSWLLWLTGSSLAIVIGLLLFGRRGRDRFAAPPVNPVAEEPARRATDQNDAAIASGDVDLDDESPTEENLKLDADLVVGTGLEDGKDMDVAHDFGFASPTEVDIELPFEPEAAITSDDTDLSQALHTSEHSVLDDESLPDDDDYDMSVIVDATKMPMPAEAKHRDQETIEVKPLDETSRTDSFTINSEVDFDILEQDYEDEFTATQALNKELEAAAANLANDVDATVEQAMEEGPTAEMPRATVTELDATAQLPSNGSSIGSLDETGVEETVTVYLTAEDKTVEMPSAENDDTTEMEIESGTVNTKAV